MLFLGLKLPYIFNKNLNDRYHIIMSFMTGQFMPEITLGVNLI